MDQNAKRLVVINLKDLFYVILKKTGIIVLVGMILAVVLGGYKLFSDSKKANLLDASVRLDGETDVTYAERVLKINRAGDLINSIDALKVQLDNQRAYASDSIFMQIDAENEAVTMANFVVSVDEELPGSTASALASSYLQYITAGEYLTGLAQEMGTDPMYLAELIRSGGDDKTVVVNVPGDLGGAETVSVVVIGPDQELTNKIMDVVIAEVEAKSIEFNETAASHTITMTSRQSISISDWRTRDKQYEVTNRFEAIQKQITLDDDALKGLASSLGVADKDTLYEHFASGESEIPVSVSSAAKFGIAGFILGALIVVAIVVTQYISGRKFTTQANFFARFPNVAKIGVAKPEGKRSGFVRKIEISADDDTDLSDGDNCRIVASNLKNMAGDMNKILFTGTADIDKISALVSKLGVKGDVKASFFKDPSTLESLSDYDGVVIVEQRNYSDCRSVTKELELIANTGTRLIGAVII